MYVRLERSAYGTGRISEGVDVAGRVVAVIEDVVTTGGQIGSRPPTSGQGARNVRYALAVVDRESGVHETLAAAHGLEFRAVFTSSELEASTQ